MTGKPEGVVAKVTRIIAAFDGRRQVLTMSQIAASAGLATSTCHRLLGEMVDSGLLDRRPGGAYGVGRRIWTAGMTAGLQQDVREVAIPYMQDLLVTVGQVVNFFVAEEDGALMLERIAGSAVGPALEPAGSKLPFHTTAGGKILLAYGPDERLERALKVLTPRTPATVTDATRLRDELETIRQQGWAESFGEHHSNSWGLAVPLRGARGNIEAALGIVTFSPLKNPKSVLTTLQFVASVISRHMRNRALE